MKKTVSVETLFPWKSMKLREINILLGYFWFFCLFVTFTETFTDKPQLSSQPEEDVVTYPASQDSSYALGSIC